MDRVPSLEETLHAVVTNRSLANIVYVAQGQRDWGYSGLVCLAHCEDDGDDGDGTAVPTGWGSRAMESAIPYFRRLGYFVTYSPDAPDFTCRLYLTLPGHTRLLNRSAFRSGSVHLCSTAPGMMRLRGVLWCIPRLLWWKHRALKPYYHPSAPGGIANIAEGVEMLNGI